MDNTLYLISRFDGAMELLPNELRNSARFLNEDDKARAEEFRLRIGRPASILLPGGERDLGKSPVTARELNAVLEIASSASAHSVRENIKNGYITSSGGYRVGLGGSAIVREGGVTGFNTLSSVAVRITKEIKGVSGQFIDDILADGNFNSTLIISPPGRGKTTMLRDIIRNLSDRGKRVSVADERGELAAMRDGVPQMDVGRYTDIIENCPKDQATMMLLRAMNPEIIAMDEITAAGDTIALKSAAGCGVGLIATVHAADVEDLMSKELYRDILGLFKKLIIIRTMGGERQYTISDLSNPRLTIPDLDLSQYAASKSDFEKLEKLERDNVDT